MNLTKLQKKILNSILKWNPKEEHTTLKILIEYIFKNFFKNIGVKISKKEISIFFPKDGISSSCYLETRKKVYELFLLINMLIQENYIDCIINDNLVPDTFSYGVTDGRIKIDVRFNHENRKFIFESLENHYYISSLLNELSKRNYLSIEQTNIKYTQYALYFNIAMGVIGMFLQLYLNSQDKPNANIFNFFL